MMLHVSYVYYLMVQFGHFVPREPTVLRIKVELQRFDSSPGNYALIDATWTIRPLKGEAVLTCRSRINEDAGQGYAGLVAGHQRALSELAERIARVAPAMAAGSTPACPAG